MKIAVVAPSLDIVGGQSIQADALCAGLRRAGYEVDFVPINPRFPQGLGWVRRCPYVRTMLNEALYFPSLHRLRRADVVHVFSASYWSFLIAVAPALLAARRFGKRILRCLAHAQNSARCGDGNKAHAIVDPDTHGYYFAPTALQLSIFASNRRISARFGQ